MLILTVLIMLGCATLPKEADMRESLRNTAERYWQLRFEGRYEETYKMEDNAGLPDFIAYRDRVMVSIKFQQSVSVGEINVAGDKGIVELKVSIILPKISKPFNQAGKEDWVFKKGKWLHIFY